MEDDTHIFLEAAMDIREGICVKCQSASIKANTLSFGSVSAGQYYQPAHYVRVYLCTTCGYTELYARDEELPKLAASHAWDAVPVTGATKRLDRSGS